MENEAKELLAKASKSTADTGVKIGKHLSSVLDKVVAGMEQGPEEELSELDKLVVEKVRLARQLGLMGDTPLVEGYEETEEYKRINEIDARLWELIE
ncbi:MAG: hypothetical protein K6T85_16360 [Gorillibacterium sp.]|nr:hypothetical protein [Gorillibacterium sp.]